LRLERRRWRAPRGDSVEQEAAASAPQPGRAVRGAAYDVDPRHPVSAAALVRFCATRDSDPTRRWGRDRRGRPLRFDDLPEPYQGNV
jgi:hypothetical protein